MLLDINNLKITVRAGGIAHTVLIPSMVVGRGQTVILMGPSGSGKSVLLKTLSGMLPSEQIDIVGEAKVKIDREKTADLLDRNGSTISTDRPVVFYIFQDPRSYLHPRLQVKQYGSLLIHRLPAEEDIGTRYAEYIEKANLSHRWNALSSHLSGGEAQRLMFAIMNVLRPRLVLADEPLSAQDRVHHEQLREMLTEYVETAENECGMILVTHEIRDIQRSVELKIDPVFYVLEQQAEQLWRCSDAIQSVDVSHLATSQLGEGSSSSSRSAVPATMVEYFKAGGALYQPNHLELEDSEEADAQEILSTKDLSFSWDKRSGSSPLFSGINLSQRSNLNLGIMGLSGVGKSTLAEVLLHLTHGWHGKIQWFGSDRIGESEMRRRVQYVFQDCERAMAWEVGTVEEAILLPFRKDMDGFSEIFRDSIKKILSILGLLDHKDKNVQHLSGGQLRRAYLARALLILLGNLKSNDPILLILDEVTVGLDLVAQYELLRLLRRFTMTEYPSMSLIVISHDPVVLRFLCNQIEVIFDDGERNEGAKVVETLKGSQIRQGPYMHEHTKLLMGNLH